MKPVVLLLALALSAASTALHAAPADDQPTMQLGTVHVQGTKQIIAVLRALKAALKAPFSTDPARANDPVCRIVKRLGDAREYLDCATNRDFIRRRYLSQLSVETGTLGVPHGTDLLRSFLAQQPDHHLYTPVNGGALQALLARLPDDATLAAPEPAQIPARPVPASVTQTAPAGATSQPATQP